MTTSLDKKRVLVIEDDDAFDLWIGIVLKRLDIVDYVRVKTVEDALQSLENKIPDLIISDIYLEDKLTGVDFLKNSLHFSIPTIIMTSSTSINLYREVQLIENVTYLVKPFQPLTLISAIENLLFGRNNNYDVAKLKEPSIFIKMSNNKHKKVYLSDVVYLESDGNYTYLYTTDGKIALKKTMSMVLNELDKRFIRCHRTFAINKQHIVSWSPNQIELKNINIPLGRSYQKLFEYEMVSTE